MESSKCTAIILLGLLAIQAVLSQPQSQCMQDLAQNEDFMRCSQSFASLEQEMQTSGAAQSGDVAQIYAAFCTPEGKAGLKCLMDFIFECPEVEAAMQMGGTMDFKEMMKQGGIDVFCEMTTSNCRPKMEACSAKMNQTSMMGPGMGDGMMEPGAGTPPPGMGPEMGMGGAPYAATPYSMVPMQMMMVCGPMHEMLTCILDAMDECPNTAKYMEQMLEKMSEMQQQKGGPAMPSYSESKKYIMESCPGLPNDFQAKQKCIVTSLAQQGFQDCYKNVTDNKKKHCDVYFGGKECVMKHVGADCGDTYAKAMASAAPLFSVDIPSGCEAQVGGVSNLQASALTMIGAGALILLGRH